MQIGKKIAAQSCKIVLLRWRNRAIYSLEKQPTRYALPETAFSLFTASQILFSARVIFDHSLCHRRDLNRWADIYNGKRLTTIRTIYGSQRAGGKNVISSSGESDSKNGVKTALTTCFTIDKGGARGKYGHESAKDEMPWSRNG